MDYESKLKAAHQELEDKGVWPSNYNPPMYRLLRKLGVQLAPPYYQSFWKNFIFVSVTFTLTWFFAFHFIIYRPNPKEIIDVAYESVIFGISFGFIMSMFYLVRRKQLKLTNWQSMTL
ncbi:MAG: DUF6404 family protein [Plesiomonas shigelloides]